MEVEMEASHDSISANKLNGKTSDIAFDPTLTYCIIQFTAVFSAISECVVCKKCGGNIKFLQSDVEGLGFKLNINCTKCDTTVNIVSSSPLIGTTYEINQRFAFVMRLLGKGLKGIKLFCSLMDLPKFILKQSYETIMNNVHVVAKTVSFESFKKAVQEETQKTIEAEYSNLPRGLTVSGDSTSLLGRYSSLLVVSSLTGHYTGKVLDIMVKGAHCTECKERHDKRETASYSEWYEHHKYHCPSNFINGFVKMEERSMVEMFSTSIEKYDIKYAYYIGEPLTMTFSTILQSRPYNDLIVEQKECIGRMQKYMAKKLRKVKTKMGQTVQKSQFADCNLNASLIDQLTLYYGLAIKNNYNSIEKMKHAIWAIFFHNISTDENPQHMYCPPGIESWCTWQKANAKGILNNYHHKPAFSKIEQTAIKSVYEVFSNEKLLRKCIGRFMPNNNSRLNAKIWKIYPQESFIKPKLKTIEIAAYIAASIFNDGAQVYLRMLKIMGVSIGQQAYNFCRQEDSSRLMYTRIVELQNTTELKMYNS